MSADPWEVAAYHEAGHCIAYLHLGRQFRSVEIYQTEAGGVAGRVRFVARLDDDHLGRAICCLAGPVAEARLTGLAPVEQPNSHTDCAMASEALARVDFAGRLDLVSIQPFTELLIEHRWPLVQFIVSRLVVYHALDYSAVVALIR